MGIYDIVVVGASIAGLACSLVTRHRTLVIERKKRVGGPVACGEYVPLAFLHRAEVPPSAVASIVEGMRTYLGSTVVERRWPGAVLDRAAWESSLYEKAKAAGVEFWFGSSAVSLDGATLYVKRQGVRVEVRGRFLVGADGPFSVVARGIGAPLPCFLGGYQYRVAGAELPPMTEIYMQADLTAGYGWLFPRGEIANVGIGGRHLRQPWKLLDDLVRKLRDDGKVGVVVREKVAGLIPAGGLREPLAADNVVLAGDAAGFTNPITGAGIHQAHWSGQRAGEAANSYLEGDRQAPRRYVGESVRFWGRQLARDRARRELMEREWGSDYEEAVRKTWIAFQ